MNTAWADDELNSYMEKLRHSSQMAGEVPFCPLWYALSTLRNGQSERGAAVGLGPRVCNHTQAMRTFFGKDVLGSLTLAKPN